MVISSAEVGGAERYVMQTVTACGDRGVAAEVAVISRGPARDLVHRLESAGVTVHVIAERSRLGVVRDLRRIVRTHRPVVVHSNLPRADVYTLAATVGVGSVAHVSTLHNLDQRYRRVGGRMLQWILLRRCQSVIAPSKAVRDYAARLARVDGARFSLIPHGVSPHDRVSDGAPSCVAIVGRVVEGKGHFQLLRALARSGDERPWTLRVLGDGPDLDRLRDEARRLGVEMDARGFVGDLAAELDGVGVAVAPTLPEMQEGFGLAVLECMSMGLPVAVSNCAAFRELLGPEGTPFVFDPNSSQSVMEAVNAAVKGGHSVGEANRVRASLLYGEQLCAIRTISVYVAALGVEP